MDFLVKKNVGLTPLTACVVKLVSAGVAIGVGDAARLAVEVEAPRHGVAGGIHRANPLVVGVVVEADGVVVGVGDAQYVAGVVVVEPGAEAAGVGRRGLAVLRSCRLYSAPEASMAVLPLRRPSPIRLPLGS